MVPHRGRAGNSVSAQPIRQCYPSRPDSRGHVMLRRALSLAGLVALAAPAVNGAEGSLLARPRPSPTASSPPGARASSPASRPPRRSRARRSSFRATDASAWTTVPLVSDAPCFFGGAAAAAGRVGRADLLPRGGRPGDRPRGAHVGIPVARGRGRGRLRRRPRGAASLPAPRRRPGAARGGGATSPAGADAGGGGKKAVLAVLGGGAAVAGGVIAATAHGGEPSPTSPPAPAAVTTPEPNLLLPLAVPEPRPQRDSSAAARSEPGPRRGPLPPPPTLALPRRRRPHPRRARPHHAVGCGERPDGPDHADHRRPPARWLARRSRSTPPPPTTWGSRGSSSGTTSTPRASGAPPTRRASSARRGSAPYSVQFALPSTCGTAGLVLQPRLRRLRQHGRSRPTCRSGLHQRELRGAAGPCPGRARWTSAERKRRSS